MDDDRFKHFKRLTALATGVEHWQTNSGPMGAMRRALTGGQDTAPEHTLMDCMDECGVSEFNPSPNHPRGRGPL